MPHSHTPGALKQTNKKHKNGAHKKRALKRLQGPGKVSSAGGGGGGGGEGSGRRNVKAKKESEGREARMNRSLQQRKQKRAELCLQKRFGSSSGAPKLIGILSLSSLADTTRALATCLSEASWSSLTEEVDASQCCKVHAAYSKHKTRCSFVRPASSELTSILELAMIADILLFVVQVPASRVFDSSSFPLIDATGENTLTALKALGCPEAMCLVQGYEAVNGKALVDVKRLVQRQLESALWPDVKIGDSTRPELMCRALCNLAPRNVAWRNNRSYVLAESVEVAPVLQSFDASHSIRIGGYLRGRPLAVDSLVHIVGVGTGRIDRVSHSSADDQEGSKKAAASSSINSSEMPVEIVANRSRQDPLRMEASMEGDGATEGEQTWPSEEEMTKRPHGGEMLRRNVPKSIPEGMSSYQADWFVDDQGQWEKEGVGEEEEEEEDLGGVGGGKEMEEEEDADEDEAFSVAGSMLDAPHLSKSGVGQDKQRLRALADSDEQFPDEMDTPADQSARDRFARYRALQSFRSSPWHPKENLPREYSRIFQFENFPGVQRRILSESACVTERMLSSGDEAFFALEGENEVSMGKSGGEVEDEEAKFVRPGVYVSIVIDGLNAEAVSRLQLLGHVMAISLHQHENRLSVSHFNIRRLNSFAEPLKSKDPLIFQVGFRSFTCRPIFSEANLKCDKHKFERFLLHDRFSIATVFAPISFMPCPLLVFKRLESGELMLVATGSLASIDPDRIVLKKVVLTGLPIRVRKRFAVVKHLFYDPQDVRWFMPAEMVTKHGLRGHIREPVGTHGLLKAIFSGPITQNDTVMLVLYKRVFPKLFYGDLPFFPLSPPSSVSALES